MDRQTRSHRPAMVALGALLALSGCDMLVPGAEAPPAAGGAAPTAAAVRMSESDVERPDIYSITARGLWDGRFSFGDRWVAVADDVKAERVRITSTESGRSIEGALFQKEPGLPGPPIMVSKNAAEALGMTAGRPAMLEVVVLRKEMVQVPGRGAPAADAPAADAPQLAVGTVETEALPGRLPPAEAPVPPAEAPATPEAAADGAAAAAGTGLAVGTVTTSALDPAAAEAPDTPAPDTPGQPPRRFQVAAGSNAAGAEAALARLQAAGLPGEVTQSDGRNGTVYRVIAGPFEDAAAARAALATLRELGYADAFAVR